MKLYTFGCCAGTEPMPNLRHTSFALETQDSIYWFDAGEGCSRTAHLMGVDLLKVKSIFISHPHMDHVGGLGNLLWNIRKLSCLKKTLPYSKHIDVYIPCKETWEGVWKILTNTEGKFVWDCKVDSNAVISGQIFKDENIEVYACHNRHLEMFEEKEELSFSYKIKNAGKTVIFSGDVKELSDLDALLDEQCDYLLIETGHHKIAQVCEYVNEKNVKNLMFIHHGREILANINQARMIAQSMTDCNVVFCEDGAEFEV